MSHRFKPGEPVVYRAQKASTSPGPRAINISPAHLGESYSYNVDKYWRVAEVKNDGNVVLLTRRGKKRVCSEEDNRLRKAGLIERVRNKSRFPEEQLLETSNR